MTDYFKKDYEPKPAAWLADSWAQWCGEDTAWVKEMRRFGALGGRIVDWGGMPRSASAIPLCFELVLPGGIRFPCDSRLKDIKAAIAFLEKP